MDKVIELDGKVSELISNYRDITNVGFDELDRVWKEIDEYRKEAHSAFQEYDSSIHRNENGRFTQASYNIAELAEFATRLDTFDNKCYDEIYRLHVEYQRKRDLYNQKNEERKILNLTNKRYALQVSKLEARNKQLDAEISLRSGQFPDLVNMYEEEKKSNEALIENYRTSMILFENRLKNYEKDLNALKNGGELSFEDDLDNNKEEVENKEVSKESTIKRPVKDDDFKDGFVPNGPVKDDDFKDGYEDIKEDGIVPPLSPNVIGDDARELGGVPEDEDEVARELGDAPEDEDEVARELGDAPEDEDEVVRELGDAPEDEDEIARELGDAPEDEDEEKVTPVFVDETVNAKPTLLQKIKNIIYKATLFLGGLSAIALTADHFINHHNIVTEEDMDEDLDEDENKEQDKTDEEQKNENIDKDDEKNDEKNDEKDNTPSVTPGNPGTDTPGTDTPGTDTPGTDTPGTDTPGTDTPGTDTPGTDTPGTDTPDDVEDQITEDNTTFPIELGAGEVAFNSETGVEVTQDGSAYLHEEDGRVLNQEDRDLDQTDHGTSVVVEEDLYEDLNTPEQTFDEQIASVPSTGEEQTYTEATQSGNLTQSEIDNLDSAFDALESYFNEEYTMQP